MKLRQGPEPRLVMYMETGQWESLPPLRLAGTVYELVQVITNNIIETFEAYLYLHLWRLEPGCNAFAAESRGDSDAASNHGCRSGSDYAVEEKNCCCIRNSWGSCSRSYAPFLCRYNIESRSCHSSKFSNFFREILCYDFCSFCLPKG